jgi:hypothetical protein
LCARVGLYLITTIYFFKVSNQFSLVVKMLAQPPLLQQQSPEAAPPGIYFGFYFFKTLSLHSWIRSKG